MHKLQMISKNKCYIILITLLLPTISLADGQDGMGLVLNAIDFIKVFGLWLTGALILFVAIKKIRRTGFSKKQKYVYWTVILVLAFFHWSMIKYDPLLTEGEIDSFFGGTKIRNKAIEDSMSAVKYLNEVSKLKAEYLQKQHNNAIIDSVLDLVKNLKIVEARANLIDSLSNHRRHISLVPTLNDTINNIYLVKVVEDNGTNLVTYFNFMVD